MQVNKNMNEVTPSETVVNAIREAFPKSCDEILANMKYYPGDDFWGFSIHGIFVGVEQSGYIHS
jgi:hypothetical protein